MPEAQADIRGLDAAIQTRVLDRLAWMGENARVLRHAALRGPEWQGCFRFRVGDYRIIYEINWAAQEIRVLKVGHRSSVYD
jgi:mRNA interferase RelE/StbE